MPRCEPFNKTFKKDAPWEDQMDEDDSAAWINNNKQRTYWMASAHGITGVLSAARTQYLSHVPQF